MLKHIKENRGLSLFVDLKIVYLIMRVGLTYQLCFFSLKLFEEDMYMPPTPGMTIFEVVICGFEFSIYTRLAEQG